MPERKVKDVEHQAAGGRGETVEDLPPLLYEEIGDEHHCPAGGRQPPP